MRNKGDTVFWAGIEYAYTPSHKSYIKLKGGFVYVFKKSSSKSEFLISVEKSFEELKLKILDYEFISPYDIKTAWEDEKITKEYKRLYSMAIETNEVVYDKFYAYTSE